MSPMKLFFALWAIIFTVAARGEALANANKSTDSSPAAPPRICEIRQKAWCIYQNGSEITDHQKTTTDYPDDHIWSMRDVHQPRSVLVIFEPNGCREGFSDKVSALGFNENVQWQGKTWDQMRIRLRSDGSCDLRLLVPVYDADPLEWAFSVGRGLIAACRDEKCTNITPTPADVTDAYREKFRRDGKK